MLVCWSRLNVDTFYPQGKLPSRHNGEGKEHVSGWKRPNGTVGSINCAPWANSIRDRLRARAGNSRAVRRSDCRPGPDRPWYEAPLIEFRAIDCIKSDVKSCRGAFLKSRPTTWNNGLFNFRRLVGKRDLFLSRMLIWVFGAGRCRLIDLGAGCYGGCLVDRCTNNKIQRGYKIMWLKPYFIALEELSIWMYLDVRGQFSLETGDKLQIAISECAFVLFANPIYVQIYVIWGTLAWPSQ